MTEVARRQPEKIVMEGMKIIFRNFAGKEGLYNREGDRSFHVLLDDDIANQMKADGWNIKWLKPREEGDIPQAHLEVSVSYKGRPPRIVLITSKGRTSLTEDMVEFIDFIDIANVDLIINPYAWNVNGNQGIKAYLHAIYVIVQEDELEKKYQDVPELGADAPLELEPAEDDQVWEAEEVLED